MSPFQFFFSPFIGISFFLSISFSLALCENGPKIIEEISGTIERNLGENATLICNVNNPEDHPVSWVKLNRENPSDQTVLSFNDALAIKDRLKLTVTPSRDKYSLEVNFYSIFSSPNFTKMNQLKNKILIDFLFISFK